MKILTNQNGFTYILALTLVMIMGIMLGMVGQSWKTIKQREQEKELLFRGSQIKEAIENWNNPNYPKPGSKPRHPIMDLKDLLQDPYSLTKIKFLPQNYADVVDEKNQKCAPDCAKLKIYQDPMTGKEWTIIRGTNVNGVVTVNPASQGGIIGVASKSDENPFRTDFKDTALENMGSTSVAPTIGGTMRMGNVPQAVGGATPGGPSTSPSNLGSQMTKYSQWQFIADKKNDHSKIYRAYHEGW